MDEKVFSVQLSQTGVYTQRTKVQKMKNTDLFKTPELMCEPMFSCFPGQPAPLLKFFLIKWNNLQRKLLKNDSQESQEHSTQCTLVMVE